MTECLVIREAIMMAIKKNFHQIIIESDSQKVINNIHGKISVLRDIVNLVENIKIFIPFLRKLAVVQRV